LKIEKHIFGGSFYSAAITVDFSFCVMYNQINKKKGRLS